MKISTFRAAFSVVDGVQFIQACIHQIKIFSPRKVLHCVFEQGSGETFVPVRLVFRRSGEKGGKRVRWVGGDGGRERARSAVGSQHRYTLPVLQIVSCSLMKSRLHDTQKAFSIIRTPVGHNIKVRCPYLRG